MTKPGSMTRGERVVRLLADPTWIHRRVETLQLSVDGETRRRVSFDFTLPKDRSLLQVTSVGVHGLELSQERVILPLCFMRKGTLVDLDVTDDSGRSLPVVSLGANGELVKEGVLWLLGELAYVGGAANAADDVIYSSLLGREVNRAEKAKIDSARKDVFTNLCRYSLASGGPPALEHLRADIHVYNLANWLVENTHQSRNTEVAAATGLSALSRRDTLIAMVSALLAAMSRDYVFAVEHERRVVGERTIVKLSYASTVDRAATKLLSRVLSPSENISLSLATAAANSTHIEIETTPSVQVTRITSVGGREHAPFSSVALAARRLHLSTSRRERSAGPRTDLLIEVSPRRSGTLVAALAGATGNLVALALLAAAAPAIIRQSQGLRIAGELAPPSEVSERLGLLRDSNAFSVALAVLGVAIALVVVVQLHDVERRLLRVPRIIVMSAAILFVASLVSASYEAHVGTSVVFDWERNRMYAVLVAAILFVWSAYCWRVAKPVREISVEACPRTGRRTTLRSPASALVATESAIFDGLPLSDVQSLAKHFGVGS